MIRLFNHLNRVTHVPIVRLCSICFIYSGRKSKKGQNALKVSAIQKKLVINSLADLIKERNSYNQRQNFENMDPNLFNYGEHPLKIAEQMMVFFKGGFWEISSHANDRLIAFLQKLENESQRWKTSAKSDPKSQQHYSLVLEYRKRLALELLPSNINKFWYASSYIHQLFCFLESAQSLTPLEIRQVMVNLNYLLHSDAGEEYYINSQDDAWQLIQATSLFLDHYIVQVDQLPQNYKPIIYMIAKNLRVTNLKFLQFVKRDLQKDKKDMNLKYFLAGLIYLSQHRSFPYQYFYRNKDYLMHILEAAENLSDKKVYNCISMLQILGMEKLIYCERIIDRLLQCLSANLGATDSSQLARIFFYYSRLKCSIDYVFVGKLMQRLYLFMHRLDSTHYALIIKAVAHLDYQDQQLVRKLKDYDYELFLTSLKYGCEKLGGYYKAIIEQVETNFKGSQNKQSDINQTITKENQTIVSTGFNLQ